MNLKTLINLLRFLYIFQIILFLIITILISVQKAKVEWMNLSYSSLFNSFLIILIIMIFFPFLFLIITLFKKTFYCFSLLLKITIALFVIKILSSFGLLTIFFININNFELYIKYCPFNFKEADLYALFPNLNTSNAHNNINLEELMNKCNNKRCFEFQEKYYLCNYNCEKKLGKENNIKCRAINNENNEDFSNILKSYINLCNFYTYFYQCNAGIKPKKYKLKDNYICPKYNNDLISLKILITVNAQFPIYIFIFHIIFYKEILKRIVIQGIQSPRDNNSEKTIDTLNNKNKSSFKKEKTEVIIIEKEFNEIIKVISKDKIIKRNKNDKIFKNKLFLDSKEEKSKEFNKFFPKNLNFDGTNKNNRLLTENNEKKKEDKNEEKKVNCIIIRK